MKTAALVVADAECWDTPVFGEPLLAHAVRHVLDIDCVAELRIVVPARRVGDGESIVRAVPGAENKCRVLPCDGSRAESIRTAFESLPAGFDVVLLCEAARAFMPAEIIRAVAETVAGGAAAVVPVLPMTDTVKLVNSAGVVVATEDRARLRAVQTPFGCTPELLHEMCMRGIDPLTEPPDPVCTIPGHQNGIRVRTPFDVAVVTALLSEEQA